MAKEANRSPASSAASDGSTFAANTMASKSSKNPALDASKAESSDKAKLLSKNKAATSAKKSSKKKDTTKSDSSKATASSPTSPSADNKENGKAKKKSSKSSSSKKESSTENGKASSSKKSSSKKTKSSDGLGSGSGHSNMRSLSKIRNYKRSDRSTSPGSKSRSSKSVGGALSKRKGERSSVSARGRKNESDSKRATSVPPKNRAPQQPMRSTSVPKGRGPDEEAAKKGDSKKAHTKSPRRKPLQRHFSDLDQLNLATSLSGDLSHMGMYATEQDDRSTSLNALVYKLRDSTLEEKLFSLFKRIEAADGFPVTRRRPADNRIALDMYKALKNDPEITSIRIEEDKRFQDVEKSLQMEFAEGLRSNLHLTSLIITGAGLEDDFITALSNSLRYNFTLRTVILCDNCFTSEGLLEFCCCLSVNESLRHVDLRNQANDVSLLQEHEKEALEALVGNKTLHVMQMHVSTEKCMGLIQVMQDRNMKAPRSIDYDRKLLQHLEAEAVNAEELQKLNLLEEQLKHQFQKDWNLLCNLAEIAEINKSEISGKYKKRKKGTSRKNLLPPEKEMSSDGGFLDAGFISKFLVEDPSGLGFMFDFTDQFKLFEKFSESNVARAGIVTKFVDALVEHKKSKEITRVIMTDSLCGDDFVVALCKKCAGNSKVLPKLFLLDLTQNCLSDAAIHSLSDCITDKKGMRYLQVLKLQEQYFCGDKSKRVYFSMESEFALTKALCQNLSLLRLDLKVQSVTERKKIEGYLARNLDLLHQAGQMKGELSKNIKHARNDLEQDIDKLADNDPAVWLLDKSEDQLFLSLKRKDVLKLAKGLAKNKFVTEVRLDRLGLDDEFAAFLGESIASNVAVRVLSLEGNAFGASGIKAIISGLAKNKTLTDLRLKGQTQEMSLKDQNEIIGLLGENSTIIKLGMDVSMDVRKQIDRRLFDNQQHQWKSQRRSLPASPQRSNHNKPEAKRKSMD